MQLFDHRQRRVLYLIKGELQLLVDVGPSGSHCRKTQAKTTSVLDGLIASFLHLKVKTGSNVGFNSECYDGWLQKVILML